MPEIEALKVAFWESKKVPEQSMNWKFEALKLGVTERVEMVREKVKDGRKAQDKRKEIESEKSIRRKNYESRKKMR